MFIYLPTVSHGSSLCTQKSFLELGGERKNVKQVKLLDVNNCVTYLETFFTAQWINTEHYYLKKEQGEAKARITQST